MRISEKNQREMAERVKEVLEEFKTEVDTVPAFSNEVLNLVSVLTDIDNTSRLFHNILEGKTDKVYDAENAMISLALKFAKVLNVYASIKGLEELKAASKIGYTDFYNMRNIDKLEGAGNILKHAESHISDISDYGVTPSDLTAFEQAIKNFRDCLNDRAEKRSERGAYREKLTSLFADMNTIIKERLDSLIILFKESNRIFYDAYWKARVIKDIGGKHAQPQEEGVTDGV